MKDHRSPFEMLGRISGLKRHSLSVAELSFDIGAADGWAASDCARLYSAGLLHDVGLPIVVAPEVVTRSGPLRGSEKDAIREHGTAGALWAGGLLDDEQAAWVASHHERWDGRGYPDGLEAEAIPRGASIIAVAEAWDTMVRSRPYPRRLGVAQAARELVRSSGTQFCPEVVDLLLALIGPDGHPRPADDWHGLSSHGLMAG